MQIISAHGATPDPFSLSSSIQPFPPQQIPNPNPNPPPLPKKKRNLPGTPDPDAEVIALSPKSLMATNRFICEICNKGFQRDQNLQLHRRGHNLPWKLRQRSNKEVRKKVYICPEKTCVHHDPSRALGDLTGIKKHYSRKHGEKKWKCDKCSKKYAVQSDWKAHTKTCGTREYKCDCGTLFSRKDSFITHRAFCDALTEESARLTSVDTRNLNFKSDESSVMNSHSHHPHAFGISQFGFRSDFNNGMGMGMGMEQQRPSLSLWVNQLGNPHINNNTPLDAFVSSSSGLATALLQKAAQMGSTRSTNPSIFSGTFGVMSSSSSQTTTSLHNNNNEVQNRNDNELNQVFHNFSSTMMGATNNNFSSFTHSSNTTVLDELMTTVQPNATQGNSNTNKQHPPPDSGEHGYTRDFLGVSAAAEGGAPPPFLPQELAKFASMASPMPLSHQFSTATTTHQ
ncbi:zinc finger protein JACKDAW [Senna tora]|uniref:Zinc finger protein JACKDAW n=1 Tax=Senna tora TaxID=362788 RepID=A0A834WDJ5_9FABA|nr:zinc finger protein JACKDAW [Senna tora]